MRRGVTHFLTFGDMSVHVSIQRAGNMPVKHVDTPVCTQTCTDAHICAHVQTHMHMSTHMSVHVSIHMSTHRASMRARPSRTARAESLTSADRQIDR